MELSVEPGEAGERIDKVVAHRAGMGRARVSELFAAGAIAVVDAEGRKRRAKKGDRAELGTVIVVSVTDGELTRTATPDDSVALAIALERDDLVVVEKPAGIASAPLLSGERGTVANGLLARYPEMAAVGFSPREPGLCHRLDTGTSGLLLAARNGTTFDQLVRAMKAGTLDKRYLLVCELADGARLPEQGEIDLPLAGHPTDSRRVVACREPAQIERLKARAAKTCYRVIQRAGKRSLVEARAARAFRHQVRVHFASLGAPLVGDELYGNPSGLGRYALHGSRLSWPGDDVVAGFAVDSPLPDELAELVA